jgi:hypothetical protein
LWLAASSCTSLREIPRADYSAVPERKGVRVETRDGLVYDFDYAAFTGDSLTGYRHRAESRREDLKANSDWLNAARYSQEARRLWPGYRDAYLTEAGWWTLSEPEVAGFGLPEGDELDTALVDFHLQPVKLCVVLVDLLGNGAVALHQRL